MVAHAHHGDSRVRCIAISLCNVCWARTFAGPSEGMACSEISEVLWARRRWGSGGLVVRPRCIFQVSLWAGSFEGFGSELNYAQFYSADISLWGPGVVTCTVRGGALEFLRDGGLGLRLRSF